MRIRLSKTAIRRYIGLLQELEQAGSSSDSIELEFMLLSHPAPKGGVGVIHEIAFPDYRLPPDIELIHAPSPNGRTARKALKSKLRNAEMLTICDPYLLDKPKGENADEYVRRLLSVLPVNTLRSLDIVYDKSREHPAVVRELKRRLPKSISLRFFTDNSIHDRVWIVDKNSAFVIGTSFGGLGKRLAFLLNLPYDDLVKFKQYLFRSRKFVQ